jgi:hypothetical protein
VIPIAPDPLFLDIDTTELGRVIRMSVIPTDNLTVRMSVFESAAHLSLSRSAEPHVCGTRLKLARSSVLSRHDHRVRPGLRIFTNLSGE